MSTNVNIINGRRKTAVARVILKEGSGNFMINKKTAKDFLKSDERMSSILVPLKLTNTMGMYDINVNVNGGGISGQVGAIRLAIAKSLLKINEEFRKVLRDNGLLTRDPRMVERKKYGHPKARKRFQFSKR